MANDKADYLRRISERGDAYGGSDGTLDLLLWCGKVGLWAVTEAEARLFWENPRAARPPADGEGPEK